MSKMTFAIRDGSRTIHSRQQGSFLDPLVAALSAEPETIEELSAALTRFVAAGAFGPLAEWRQGMCGEPYGAGISIVDLAARLVVTQSTYSTPGPSGEVLYRDADRDLEAWLPYHVSDDWRFVDQLDAWEGLAESRRRARQSLPPLDARQVLYGRVAPFIVGEAFAARTPIASGNVWAPPDGWSLQALRERARPDKAVTAEDAVAEIHARWLMTPREDLRGQSPRDVLTEKREHIDLDLQHRGHQWSMLGQCPPALSRESAAFRFGAVGTHENVLYYEMVRSLAWECWQRVVEPAGDAAATAPTPADVIQWLCQVQERWLNEPNWEDLSGRTPAEVIRCERERIPMAVSGKQAMADDDCPLCQMLGDSPGPVFWHLDGCNMDNDFAFSFYHRTRQEWEEEERRYEEFSRKCDEKRGQSGAESPDESPWGDEAESPSIWKGSYSNPEVGEESPELRLFGIGAHVAELMGDLKDVPDASPLVESLNRQFGNLRSAVADPCSSLVGPVVQRFCEELNAAAEARPDLALKCAGLERQLREFAASLAGEEDIPF